MQLQRVLPAAALLLLLVAPATARFVLYNIPGRYELVRGSSSCPPALSVDRMARINFTRTKGCTQSTSMTLSQWFEVEGNALSNYLRRGAREVDPKFGPFMIGESDTAITCPKTGPQAAFELTAPYVLNFFMPSKDLTLDFSKVFTKKAPAKDGAHGAGNDHGAAPHPVRTADVEIHMPARKEKGEEHHGEGKDGEKKHGEHKHETKISIPAKRSEEKHHEGKHEDKKHGDKEHGDKEHGDKEHGDKKHGDKKHGDKKHGDKKHGDKTHGHGKMHGKEEETGPIVLIPALIPEHEPKHKAPHKVHGSHRGEFPLESPSPSHEADVPIESLEPIVAGHGDGHAHAVHAPVGGHKPHGKHADKHPAKGSKGAPHGHGNAHHGHMKDPKNGTHGHASKNATAGHGHSMSTDAGASHGHNATHAAAGHGHHAANATLDHHAHNSTAGHAAPHGTASHGAHNATGAHGHGAAGGHNTTAAHAQGGHNSTAAGGHGSHNGTHSAASEHSSGSHSSGSHSSGSHGTGKHSDGKHSDGKHGDGKHGDGDGKHGDGKHSKNESSESSGSTSSSAVGLLEQGRMVELNSRNKYVALNDQCLYQKTSSPNCFPASSLVTLRSGKVVRLDELALNAEVLVRPGVYSRVFMWTHADADARESFVRLTAASGAVLTLSHGHFVYADGSAKPAHAVRRGETLLLADGASSRVMRVETVRSKGLYNPQTLSGDIVVDGVVATTYTTAVAPPIAHALLAPLRALYAAVLALWGIVADSSLRIEL